MEFGFSKPEKLKSRTLIQLLFSEGSAVSKYPLKLIFVPAGLPENIPAQAGVSVPKRNFKRATDRNHIKRLLREAYRLQKPELYKNLDKQYVFMILYTGKDMPDFNLIQHKMQGLFQKFIQNQLNNR